MWCEAKYPSPLCHIDQLHYLKPAIPRPFFAGALLRRPQTWHSPMMTEGRPLGFDKFLTYRIFRCIFHLVMPRTS